MVVINSNVFDRIFLKEVDDPKAMLEANDSFLKIAKVDSVPVMENKEVVKLFTGMTA